MQAAIDQWGRLDTVVNNAGIVRDRMIVSMDEAEWDAVMRVHLKGTFAVTRHAAAHWRERAKSGEAVDARVVNTSSGAGLAGSIGQANYTAAKAGIAAFTLVAAAELGRYGVTVNAIAPSARTRMTETVFVDMMARPESGFDAMHPDNIAPLVVWLGSDESGDVTGRVFELAGGHISVAQGWLPGPEADKGDRWDPAELGPVIRKLLSEAVDTTSRLRDLTRPSTGADMDFDDSPEEAAFRSEARAWLAEHAERITDATPRRSPWGGGDQAGHIRAAQGLATHAL